MDLNIEIFCDTARLDEIAAWATEPRIRGFTVNPTLLRQAGVVNYSEWAHAALALVPELPLSLRLLGQGLGHMAIQAGVVSEWGRNIYVKIPVQTSAGESTLPLIERLSHDGIQLNVTAVFTALQMQAAAKAVRGGAPCLISVFAGRVADTGLKPGALLKGAGNTAPWPPNVRLLWASARQVGDVLSAMLARCDIITLPPALLQKLPLLGKDLDEYSRETVAQFEEAARDLRW